MNKAVDPALEVLLDGPDLWLDGATIIWNIQHRPGNAPSKQTVYRGLSDLVSAGLVDKVENGRRRYQINPDGIAYLEGDLDASSRSVD